jgi:hypothetical protein
MSQDWLIIATDSKKCGPISTAPRSSNVELNAVDVVLELLILE